MAVVFIAIGSNLGDPLQKARNAIRALEQAADIHVRSCSSLYSSSPMGPQDQPDYVNAVIEIETDLEPLALLDQTQAIELEHGRVRKAERWGPRTLDLDILLYDQQIIDNARLTVPHYGMKEREFVLYPLAEIAPEMVLPDGTKLAQLTKTVDKNGLEIIASA